MTTSLLSETTNEISTNQATDIMETAEKKANPIKSFVDSEKLAKDIAINPVLLDDAYMKHAGLFLYYGTLSAKAREQFHKMKAAFEILESRLYAEHRLLLSADGKKATEAQIDAAVKADSRWWAGKNRLIEAEGVFNLASNAANAFEQRRDMLIQIGADRRTERQNELRVSGGYDPRAAALEALSKTKAA